VAERSSRLDHQLEPDRCGLGCNAHLTGTAGGELSDWLMSLVGEATVKAAA
jgi:hypothetical protein